MSGSLIERMQHGLWQDNPGLVHLLTGRNLSAPMGGAA